MLNPASPGRSVPSGNRLKSNGTSTPDIGVSVAPVGSSSEPCEGVRNGVTDDEAIPGTLLVVVACVSLAAVDGRIPRASKDASDAGLREAKELMI